MRLSMLGWLLPVVAGCHAAAAGTAEETIALDPRPGIGLIEQGDLEGGIDALRVAIAAAPGDVDSRIEAHCWIGHALAQLGDSQGALEEYRLALELAPGDPWLHYACGVSWSRMGELERAVECFSSALALDPRHVKAWQWRGEMHHQLGEEQAAVEDFTRALECIESADEMVLASWGETRSGLFRKTLELRAEAYEALGELEAARRDQDRIGGLLVE